MPGIVALRPNTNANIEAEIIAISPVRQVSTQRGPSEVADATLKDATGTVTLTLWGPETTKYRVGQKIRLTDGWVKEFRGKLQVSLGRSGSIEVLSP